MKSKAKRIVSWLILSVIAAASLCMTGFTKKSEVRYNGYGEAVLYSAETTKETINFTKREYTYVETVKAVPKYDQLSDLPNSCGPTAGATIVGFYDKQYEELIPDYTAYLPNGRYKGRDMVYVPKLMCELYTLMRTNVDAEGVSQTDCLNGLRTYVNNCGRTLTYSNVKSGYIINETSYAAAINNNMPVILFCRKMDVYNMSATSTSETVVCTNLDGAHVAVGYGIYTVDYYNGDTIFRTDKYVRISTGLNFITDGYLKISSTDWCNAAYSVLVA